METHILNVLWRKLCFLESQSDRTRRLFRRIAHAHTVKCLASGGVPADLGVNFCSSRASMIIVLEHKHPRTLGENEAIAVSRERSRRSLRLIVPRLGKCPNHCVTLYDSFRDRRVHTASDEHWLHPGLNMLIGIAESVG